jgi:Xaa-Pro aminopeptidase
MTPLWFPRSEYEARARVLTAELDRRGLDALLLTWHTNLAYYTGYRPVAATSMLTRPSAALLSRAADPVLWVHTFLEADARASAWFHGVRTYGRLDGLPADEVAAEVRAQGLRRIGVELGVEQRLGMPASDFAAIRERLSRVEWADAGPLMWAQRARKSAAELDCLRRAAHATARAYEAVLPTLAAGMTEREVGRLLQRAMLDAGADQIGFVMITSGRGNYARISGLPTDRRLGRGDMVWTDMGARVNGYWADFSRAAVIGAPTDEQQRMQELVIAATARGVERAGPGVAVGEIVRACEDEMRRRGEKITFAAGRVGHGLGLNLTEWPHVAMYDNTVLEPGMAITVEPGIVEPYGTFHVEDNLIITEMGAEVISTARRELWSVP